MNKKIFNLVSISIKILMGIIVTFIPSISNNITLESNTMGGYAIAFFLATCAVLSFTTIYIGMSLNAYILSFSKK